MEPDPTHLLEQYIIGKDQDQFKILETIYDTQAEVSFEISADTITFPGTISGSKEIARILSADFNRTYEKIRTYYLSKLPAGTGDIKKQTWLVIMKVRNKDLTRIGTGYYNWSFTSPDHGFKIIRQKIYIHEMLEFEDKKSVQLAELQAKLTYPWAEIKTVTDLFKNYDNLAKVTGYLITLN